MIENNINKQDDRVSHLETQVSNPIKKLYDIIEGLQQDIAQVKLAYKWREASIMKVKIFSWHIKTYSNKKKSHEAIGEGKYHKKLRKLKNRGTMHEYMTEFMILTLQIPNLSNDDWMFYFIK